MLRNARLVTLGFVCLGAVQAAIAAPIYRVQELFPLPGHVAVHANAINAAGQVVGFSRAADLFAEAVLWSGATVRNLRSPQDSRFLGFAAADINDFGQIVGIANFCEPPTGCGGLHEFNIGMGPVVLPVSVQGSGPRAWVADPSSPVGVPIVETCAGPDTWALHVSNPGYTVNYIGN